MNTEIMLNNQKVQNDSQQWCIIMSLRALKSIAEINSKLETTEELQLAQEHSCRLPISSRCDGLLYRLRAGHEYMGWRSCPIVYETALYHSLFRTGKENRQISS